MVKPNLDYNYEKRYAPERIFRNRHLLVIDIVIIALAYVCAFFAVIDNFGEAFARVLDYKNIVSFCITSVIYIFFMYFAGIYSTMWIHSGTKDYLRIIKSELIATFAFIAAAALLPSVFVCHIKLYLCIAILIFIGLLFMRMLIRGIYNIYTDKTVHHTEKKRLMIVGAGTSAAIFLKDIQRNENLNYDIICFVDDDKNKHRATIDGIKVRGGRYDIPTLAEENDIDEILIAMPSADATDRKKIIEICNETDCKIKILPSIDQMIGEKAIRKVMRDVQIEDLLARDPIKLDNSGIENYIKDRVILVTGGGGSIGSELCRQIMCFKPKKLIVLDIYENNAYDLQMELNRKYPENPIEVVIASVRDKERLEKVFEKYNPYIVFHAAAHKHVPLMEDSPGEAIKNNIFGTLNVTKCADKYKVKRFVMISTDKAVNPTNVMGATKRMCEMIVQCAQKTSSTEFVVVRFGNVLGSNGSVVPLFKRQIEQGGPVTITDKRITRFFMTIPEAAQLVIQAASYAKGGEIFVLDMGEPVKIYDLAKNLIRLSGYKPEKDIKISVCGLRPGEKLYEELMMDEEGLTNTSHNKIFIGKSIEVDKDKLTEILDNLKRAADTDDNESIKIELEKAVPTYKRKK